MQIIQNLAKIEALPKCIQNKSSKIQNLFSAKIPPLVQREQFARSNILYSYE